jgi:hypothetical protein
LLALAATSLLAMDDILAANREMRLRASAPGGAAVSQLPPAETLLF